MTEFKKLVKGEKLSETQFYEVDKVDSNSVRLLTDDGQLITVDNGYAEQHLTSASQFSTVQPMNRTDLANLFLASRATALTVNYYKQIKQGDVEKQIFELYPNKGGKILSESDYKKKVSSALKGILTGEERIMVGRHYGSQDEFGRVHFIDMEQFKDPAKDYDTRQRLVDPRTIQWMILRGIKYELK